MAADSGAASRGLMAARSSSQEASRAPEAEAPVCTAVLEPEPPEQPGEPRRSSAMGGGRWVVAGASVVPATPAAVVASGGPESRDRRVKRSDPPGGKEESS